MIAGLIAAVSALVMHSLGLGSSDLLLVMAVLLMAYTLEQGIPRYIIHVRAHSELVSRLMELERKYRLVG